MAILVKRLPRENSLNITMWVVNPIITMAQAQTNAMSSDAQIAARAACSALEKTRDKASSLDQIIIAVVVAVWPKDEHDLILVPLRNAERLGSFEAAIAEAREDVFRVVEQLVLKQNKMWGLNAEITDYWRE